MPLLEAVIGISTRIGRMASLLSSEGISALVMVNFFGKSFSEAVIYDSPII